MEQALAALEQLAPVRALKVSFYAYPLVNALHIMAIGAVVTCTVLMDMRILGFAGFVEREPLLRLLRRTIATAFTAAVLSGVTLFSVRAGEYAANPAFLTKMCLLAAAGINLWAFRRVRRGAPGVDYPPAARMLAMLSIALWTAILVAGRFIGFV